MLDEVSRRSVSARMLQARWPPRAESPLRLVLALAAAQGRPHGAGAPEGDRAGRRGDLAGRDRSAPTPPRGRRSRARAPERWEQGGERRRRAMRSRGRAAGRAHARRCDGLIAAPFDGRRVAAARDARSRAARRRSRSRARAAAAARRARRRLRAAPRSSELRAAGFVAASLGPRILRAETAAVAAVATRAGRAGAISRRKRAEASLLYSARSMFLLGADRREIPDPLQPRLRRLRHGLPRPRHLDRQEGRDQGPAPPDGRLRRPAAGAAPARRARSPEHRRRSSPPSASTASSSS